MQIRDHKRLSVLTKKETKKIATQEELLELEELEFMLIEQLNESELDDSHNYLK